MAPIKRATPEEKEARDREKGQEQASKQRERQGRPGL